MAWFLYIIFLLWATWFVFLIHPFIQAFFFFSVLKWFPSNTHMHSVSTGRCSAIYLCVTMLNHSTRAPLTIILSYSVHTQTHLVEWTNSRFKIQVYCHVHCKTNGYTEQWNENSEVTEVSLWVSCSWTADRLLISDLINSEFNVTFFPHASSNRA